MRNVFIRKAGVHQHAYRPKNFTIGVTIIAPTRPPMAKIETVMDHRRVNVPSSTEKPYLLSHVSL